ncbi:hypothetical protein O0L34_g17361 [Tuta absoluta]|nr:hypothetical protein O0L34_g17361 [Tuta absoluta]
MSKKLHYFHLNGLGEPIRYILHYAGEKFEDVRLILKTHLLFSALPYGQLPLYEENGRSLNQSLAIARYVAHKAHLLPSDPWEQAKLDAIVYNIYDFWMKFVVYLKEQDPVKKEEVKKQILEEFVDFYFSRFEKELKNNGGFFGGKLSWADFILIGIVETVNLIFKTEIEKKYPTVTALINKIKVLPGVKEYIAVRKPYSF